MGQRLVITIERNSEPIAALYYHWSAYTVDALQQLAKMIINIGSMWKLPDDKLQLPLIRFVESEGGAINGGVDSPEFNMISDKFPGASFNEAGDRNDGLISIFPDYITKLRRAGELEIVVDLDSHTVTNYVIGTYDSLEDLNEDYETNFTEADFTEIDFDPASFQMDDCVKIYNRLYKLWHRGIYWLKHDGLYYILVY